MIIGIVGSPGAGKGTVVEYLVQKGFKHYSASGFITEEIERRGMPVNRDSMNVVANDLRSQHHPAYLFEQLYDRATAAGGDTILEAPRAVAEAMFLKEHGALILAVDADRSLRYVRIAKRGSAKDNVTFEQFSIQEDREAVSDDPTKQNVLGVMKIADATLHNDGTLEELHAQVDAALEKFTK